MGAEEYKNSDIVRESFSSGAVLCEQGKMCPHLYILLEGEIQIKSEGRVVQLIRKKGSIVGELNGLFGRPASTTIQTLSDSECLVLPVEYFKELIYQSPEEGVNLLGILARHILREKRRIPELEQALEELSPEVVQNATDAGNLKKIILIAATKDQLESLRYHFSPIGYDVVYFNDPAVVIQELDEIDPEMIIFAADDFPRHWKPLLTLLRERKAPEETVFILIVGENFSFEEAAKAAHLNVNGIVPKHLLDKTIVYRVNELIRRYKSLQDRRKLTRLIPKEFEQVRLLMTHPQKGGFIGGNVTDISLEGMSFLPSDPSLIQNLGVDQKLPRCSLRIGSDVITVNCRVVSKGKSLGVEFESFEKQGHQKLFKYLMERPEREIENRLRLEKRTAPV